MKKYPYVLGFVQKFDELFRVVINEKSVIVEKERTDAMGNRCWMNAGEWQRFNDGISEGEGRPSSLALLCICEIADERWNGSTLHLRSGD
jgi:hypothetical protein